MKQTKILTEGALFAALFAIILFLTIYVPFIGAIIVWFLPLPFIIYIIRHGMKPTITLWIVALFITFIVGGIIVLPLTLFFGSGGIVVGELYRRQKSAFVVLLGGSLTYIANLLIYFVASIVIFDIHPLHAIQEMMRQSIEMAESMLRTIGQEPAGQMEPMYILIDRIIHMVPVILILVGVSYALIIQLVSNGVIKKLGYKISTFPPFREWSFPKSFLWYYLIVSIFVIIGVEEGTTLFTIVWNLFPILEIIMTIQGLSFIFYYCYKKEIGKALPIIILISGLFLPFILYLVRILGIIDLGFDLRKRMESQKK